MRICNIYNVLHTKTVLHQTIILGETWLSLLIGLLKYRVSIIMYSRIINFARKFRSRLTNFKLMQYKYYRIDTIYAICYFFLSLSYVRINILISFLSMIYITLRDTRKLCILQFHVFLRNNNNNNIKKY